MGFICFLWAFFFESYVIWTDHMPVISVQCECTFEEKNVARSVKDPGDRWKCTCRSCIPLNVKVGFFGSKLRIGMNTLPLVTFQDQVRVFITKLENIFRNFRHAKSNPNQILYECLFKALLLMRLPV